MLNTVLMPLPNVPGDGTPGSIDVVVRAGQSLFLPLIGVFGTSYTDGSPPDTFVDIAVFKDVTLKLEIDGKTIVTEDEVPDVCAQSYFNLPIPVNSPPVDSIIDFQSRGLLHRPLSPGKHVLQLDEKQTVPVFGYTAEYHNTFNLTVQPPTH